MVGTLIFMPFILASQSPRRKELFKAITLDFDIKIADIDEENYPSSLLSEEIPLFLAREKAKKIALSVANTPQYALHNIVACDTVVILENEIIGKPENLAQAKLFLQKISNNMHLVVSGVCVRSVEAEIITFSEVTRVYFNEISDNEIDFYLKNYPPLDKAGAYGIQEWIGVVGVQKLEGCYYNVMGLPMASLYKHLKQNNLLYN
jgi:septum formation protein